MTSGWRSAAPRSFAKRARRFIMDQAPLSGREKAAALSLFALLVMLRLPKAWLYGRLLDEEGTIFFAYAWHRPALEAMFRSFGGYLNIAANATTLVAVKLVRADVVPLTLAPYVTMTFALLFQLLPALLILTGRAPWLPHRRAVLGSLLIVAIAPRTEEVFGNVLHIQFHLALGAALILALDVPRAAAARAGYGLMLFLAPLCGPGAIVLAPFFALRTLVDRRGARLVQTVALGGGAAIQMLMFFVPNPLRGAILDPVTLAAIMFVRLVLLPFATTPIADLIGGWIYLAYDLKILTWLAALAALGWFALLFAATLRGRGGGAFWLVAPGLAVAAVSFGGGMIVADRSDWFSPGAGQRYNFLPLVLLSLGLVALAVRPGEPRRRLWRRLFLLTLVSGAMVYPLPLRELREGPSWRGEVAAWQRDHEHRLATWPEAWTVDLSDRDRPCSRPVPIPAVSHDPGYCESSWLAYVAGRIREAHNAHRQDPPARDVAPPPVTR